MDISQYSAQTLLGPRAGGVDPVQPIASRVQQGRDDAMQDADGLFDTFLDTLNPLQHIPGVGSVYREVTGDTANPLASMAGGFLFGGPVGLAAGAAGSFLEMLTGKSLAGHAMALFSGEDGAPNGDADGAGAIRTAAADAAPLVDTAKSGASLQNYQQFASVADDVHKGFGAKATDVGWAENVWTQQALKEATGSYETNQRLGGSKDERLQRTV